MQIVQCNALPTLILMLRSEDAAIHYEAVRPYAILQFWLWGTEYSDVNSTSLRALSHTVEMYRLIDYEQVNVVTDKW